MRSRVYDLYVIAIEMPFLLRTNHFELNWIIDTGRKKVCTQTLLISIV